MPRKISKVRRKIKSDVPQWQLDYLLEGIEPEDDSIDGAGGWAVFEFLYPGGRLGKSWRHTWDQIKDSGPVKEWKRKNPGQKTYAEILSKKG